jgi:hypothetical protein
VNKYSLLGIAVLSSDHLVQPDLHRITENLLFRQGRPIHTTVTTREQLLALWDQRLPLWDQRRLAADSDCAHRDRAAPLLQKTVNAGSRPGRPAVQFFGPYQVPTVFFGCSGVGSCCGPKTGLEAGPAGPRLGSLFSVTVGLPCYRAHSECAAVVMLPHCNWASQRCRPTPSPFVSIELARRRQQPDRLYGLVVSRNTGPEAGWASLLPGSLCYVIVGLLCHCRHTEFFQGFRHIFPGIPGIFSRLFYTSLQCSRLSLYVPILQTFIIYGVSETESSVLTCKKELHYSIVFCDACLPKLQVNVPKFSRVSRHWELTKFPPWT